MEAVDHSHLDAEVFHAGEIIALGFNLTINIGARYHGCISSSDTAYWVKHMPELMYGNPCNDLDTAHTDYEYIRSAN